MTLPTLISPPDTPKASSFLPSPRPSWRCGGKIPTFSVRRLHVPHDEIIFDDTIAARTIYGDATQDRPETRLASDPRELPTADEDRAHIARLETRVNGLTADLESLRNELNSVTSGLTRQLNLTNFDLGVLSTSTKKLRRMGSMVNELTAFATRCKQCIDHHAAHVARHMSLIHGELRRDQDHTAREMNTVVKELGRRSDLQIGQIEMRDIQRLDAMERRMEERIQAIERRLAEDSKAQIQKIEHEFERRIQSIRDSSTTTHAFFQDSQ